jgi:hypothetical protein
MKETIKELRSRFEAETDVEKLISKKDWQQYAEWLEKLSYSKINNELIVEINNLRAAFYQVIDILDVEVARPVK